MYAMTLRGGPSKSLAKDDSNEIPDKTITLCDGDNLNDDVEEIWDHESIHISDWQP